MQRIISNARLSAGLTLRYAAIATCVIALSLPANAAQFEALGRSVNVPAPEGYCELGATIRQREIFEAIKSRAAFGGLVTYVAAPCSDLRRLESGSLDELHRTVTIMVVTTQGQLKLNTSTRQVFLKTLGKGKATNLKETNQKLANALEESNLSLALSSFDLVGSDDTAVYWAGSGQIRNEYSGTTFRVASISAAVLINQLPLSIQYSQRSGALAKPLKLDEIQRYAGQLVKSNETLK